VSRRPRKRNYARNSRPPDHRGAKGCRITMFKFPQKQGGGGPKKKKLIGANRERLLKRFFKRRGAACEAVNIGK